MASVCAKSARASTARPRGGPKSHMGHGGPVRGPPVGTPVHPKPRARVWGHQSGARATKSGNMQVASRAGKSRRHVSPLVRLPGVPSLPASQVLPPGYSLVQVGDGGRLSSSRPGLSLWVRASARSRHWCFEAGRLPERSTSFMTPTRGGYFVGASNVGRATCDTSTFSDGGVSSPSGGHLRRVHGLSSAKATRDRRDLSSKTSACVMNAEGAEKRAS